MSQPLHPCPCCREETLERPAAFEICPHCGWEDDGQCDADADAVHGGPNAGLSLTEARANWTRHGSAQGVTMWRLLLIAEPDDEEDGEQERVVGLAFLEAGSVDKAWDAVELELRADGLSILERVSARRAHQAPDDADEKPFYDEALREKFVLVLIPEP
jgi:hypothetical protein